MRLTHPSAERRAHLGPSPRRGRQATPTPTHSSCRPDGEPNPVSPSLGNYTSCFLRKTVPTANKRTRVSLQLSPRGWGTLPQRGPEPAPGWEPSGGGCRAGGAELGGGAGLEARELESNQEGGGPPPHSSPPNPAPARVPRTARRQPHCPSEPGTPRAAGWRPQRPRLLLRARAGHEEAGRACAGVPSARTAPCEDHEAAPSLSLGDSPSLSPGQTAARGPGSPGGEVRGGRRLWPPCPDLAALLVRCPHRLAD